MGLENPGPRSVLASLFPCEHEAWETSRPGLVPVPEEPEGELQAKREVLLCRPSGVR